MAADEWQYKADKRTTVEVPKTTELSVQFDEGAEQVVPRPFTAIPIVYHCVFILDGDSVIQAAFDFLIGKNGMPFTWTPNKAPFTTQQYWRASNWTLFYEGGLVAGINVDFKIFYPT
jgi:hypothetical protein